MTLLLVPFKLLADLSPEQLILNLIDSGRDVKKKITQSNSL